MYKFGNRSREQLMTCHDDIQKILIELIKVYDFSVLEGLRTTERQQMLFKEGRSKLDGIHKLSKHQDHGDGVSHACDIMPYKRGTNAFSGDDKDEKRFYFMMGMVQAITTRLLKEGQISHNVRFGLDWDGDETYKDQTFDDLPHFELVPA